MASVSDSVFSEGSVLRSVSECDRDESDEDPLEEYETQYFGFTPKSFMNGGKWYKLILCLILKHWKIKIHVEI